MRSERSCDFGGILIPQLSLQIDDVLTSFNILFLPSYCISKNKFVTLRCLKTSNHHQNDAKMFVRLKSLIKKSFPKIDIFEN